MQIKINKAVFPLTGSRASALCTVGSGSLLSIVDKSQLRYAVEEPLAGPAALAAPAASIHEMIFIVDEKAPVQATAQFGLCHPAVCNEFRAFLRTLPFTHPAPALQLAAVPPQADEAIAFPG